MLRVSGNSVAPTVAWTFWIPTSNGEASLPESVFWYSGVGILYGSVLKSLQYWLSPFNAVSKDYLRLVCNYLSEGKGSQCCKQGARVSDYLSKGFALSETFGCQTRYPLTFLRKVAIVVKKVEPNGYRPIWHSTCALMVDYPLYEGVVVHSWEAV
jgi:hypothetical protein